jgi:CubicO group peptidase (beta-lactamase class C family)
MTQMPAVTSMAARMSIRSIGSIFFFLALLSGGLHPADLSAQAYTRTALTDSVDAMFEAWDREGSPGFALGIFKDGRIIYARGYGMANLEYDIPITPQSVFRIGSLSKQFTAMCVALLEEEGKLSLEDDIRTFFPEMPAYETPITVGHLLHHTSGIRDYLTLQEVVARGEYYDSDDALAMVLRQKGVNFTPGDQFSYSNSGYFLLGALVERVSGMKMSEFARIHIFEPLGMASTHFHDDLDVIVRNRASGYRPDGGDGYRINMTQLDIIGDGSVYTTIEDFFKWDQNFYHNELGRGTGELIDEVQTRGVLNDGEEISYAFGMNVDTHRGLKRVSHTGSWVGFRTVAVRYPDQRFSVVIFGNGSLGPSRFADRIVDLYLEDQFTEPEPPREEEGWGPDRPEETRPSPVRLSPSQARAFQGIYFSEELDAHAFLDMVEGQLVMRLGMHTAEVVPSAEDAFEWRRMPVEFERDAAGDVTGFVLHPNLRFGLPFKRIDGGRYDEGSRTFFPLGMRSRWWDSETQWSRCDAPEFKMSIPKPGRPRGRPGWLLLHSSRNSDGPGRNPAF